MSNEVLTTEAARPPASVERREAGGMLSMIRNALESPNTSVEVLRELLAVRREYEADEARKAYHDAFARFKREPLHIYKTAQRSQGPLTGQKYAELADFTRVIAPAMAKHGLSSSWRITIDKADWIEITCTVTHAGGHSESVAMGGPIDTGAGRSAIQARASSVTYLERYTLKMITGLAEQGDDSDAAESNQAAATLDEEQIAAIEALITEIGIDRFKFLEFCKADSVASIPQYKYRKAIQALEDRRRGPVTK